MALSILFDAAQKRAYPDRLTALAGGTEWDPNYYNNVFFERVTGRLMLLPNVFSPSWFTSGTTPNYRYHQSDYTFISPSAWRQEDVSSNGIGDTYLTSDGPLGELVYGPAQPANGAMWVSIMPYGSQNGGDGYFEMGWSNSGEDPTTALTSLRVYLKGKVEIYRSGIYDGEQSCAGTSGQSSQLPPSQFVGFLIIPCCQRELMVVSTLGGAFSHVFQDIAEGTDGTILPNTQFWWRVPTPQQPKVQVAPAFFAASGSASSLAVSFRKAPSSAQITATPVFTLYRDNPTLGGSSALTLGDAANPANPYGTSTYRDARLNLSLTSSVQNTPMAYGGMAVFEPIAASTPANAVDLLDYCLEFSFDVGDDLNASTFRAKFNSPDAITALPVPNFLGTDNRPVQLQIGGTDWLGLVAKVPSWDEAISDDTRRVQFVMKDKLALAEEYLFSELNPLDGLDLRDAFHVCCDVLGLELDMDDPSFSIPRVSTPGAGRQWSTAIDVGDKAQEWIRKLYDAYIGNWFIAVCPGGTDGSGILRVKNPAGMSTTPVATLYGSIEDAMTIGGYSQAEAWKWVYRTLHTSTLPIEANEVVVVGRDPRTSRPIVVTKSDATGQDPAVAVASRSSTWLGSSRKYGWRDENGITTLDVAQQCCELLFARLNHQWQIREIECEMLFNGSVPAWKGDVINLHGIGNAVIKTLSGSCAKEPNGGDTWQWRPCRYVVDEGMAQFSLRTSATTGRGIKAAHMARINRNRQEFTQLGASLVGLSPIVAVL